jgi:hypothetical protein
MTRKFIWQTGTRRRSRFERGMLSKKVKAKHFAIVPGGVETTNRRFAMMGVPLVAWLFIKTILFGHWNSYFLNDQHY